MRWLISTSLHLRIAVLVLAGMLVYFGLSEVRRAPLDVFPEFAPPLVEIQTEARRPVDNGGGEPDLRPDRERASMV